MPGDHVTSEGGQDLEFRSMRSGRPPVVVSQKYAALALIGGMLTGGASTGAVANFVFRAAVQAEIRQHDRDPEAHAAFVRAMERVQQASSVDDADKARLQTQLDTLQRKVEETREAVIRLEAQLRRGSR